MMLVKEINPDQSLADYGLDSLVAVEIRNRLLRELDATVPILELLKNMSLRGLVQKIVKKSKLIGVNVLESEGVQIYAE